jgi:MFS family permease
MPSEATAPPTGRYGWWVVFVLIIAYTFSYIDRSILTLMVGPIRASLGITDVELSLLHGFAFAIFYTILGVPLGRIVDSRKRTTVVAVGVALWSVMTALCGLARTFGQMFLARVGVGVGEAALSPAAYSMLSDWFAGKQLTRALSLYNAAIYMGAGLATLVGGTLIASIPSVETDWFGTLEPWRVVFILVGVPGLAVALLVLSLREPVRRGAIGAGPPPLSEVMRYIWDRRGAYGWLIIGLSIASTMWNGVGAWTPAHFMRNFGWTPAEVGVRYGTALLVMGPSGIIFGGWLAGWLRDRGRADANVRIAVISGLAALPFGVLAPLAPDAWLSLAGFCGFIFAATMPYGGAAAALQELTPNRMRGQISAVYLFFLNLAGIGLGPTLVALFTQNVFGEDAAVNYSISVVVAITAPLSALLLMRACAHQRQAEPLVMAPA